MNHTFKVGDRVRVVDLRDGAVVVPDTTITKIEIATSNGKDTATVAAGFRVWVGCLRPFNAPAVDETHAGKWADRVADKLFSGRSGHGGTPGVVYLQMRRNHIIAVAKESFAAGVAWAEINQQREGR